jgi:hypothetical protein
VNAKLSRVFWLDVHRRLSFNDAVMLAKVADERRTHPRSAHRKRLAKRGRRRAALGQAQPRVVVVAIRMIKTQFDALLLRVWRAGIVVWKRVVPERHF